MAVLAEPIAVAGTTTPETWFEGTQPGTGPADAGATTLTVVDPADFADDGGTLTVGDDPATWQIIDYTAVDDDTGVITLAEPLAATWAEGERVCLYPPAFEKYAQVMVGDFSEAVQVTVPHALWNKIADGVRPDGEGEVITFVLDGGEFVIAEIVGAEPIVDGGYLDDETTPPETFMDGSLYGTIGFVDGGFIAGDILGARVEMSAAGLSAYDTVGDRTFQVDALTGDVTTVGMFASSLAPQEAHVVIGDLAGTGTTRSFMYFYTGEELDSAGTPITGYAPGEVSSGIDTDLTRYIKLRSPDNPTVNQGELTIRSSIDANTRPVLGWPGDIRLRGDQGIVYALNASGARAPLTIDGSALVLSVPNGTMRLGEASATSANRLRSRDTNDTARRKLELEADTIELDVASGLATMRGASGWRFQLGNQAGDIGLVFLDVNGLRVSNWAGGGHRPVAASSFDVNSDSAAKTTMTGVDPTTALQQVRGVKVYDYTRKDDNRRQRGMLAQDVQQTIPIAAVEYEDGALAVDLYGMAATSAAALQALAARLEVVEAKTAHLPTPRKKAT